MYNDGSDGTTMSISTIENGWQSCAIISPILVLMQTERGSLVSNFLVLSIVSSRVNCLEELGVYVLFVAAATFLASYSLSFGTFAASSTFSIQIWQVANYFSTIGSSQAIRVIFACIDDCAIYHVVLIDCAIYHVLLIDCAIH